MEYNVYIRLITMVRAAQVMVKNLRAPVQILMLTKERLDQIMAEKKFRTYDEAIMFLITERQLHFPSDFGIFPDLKEYVCDAED